MTRDYDFKKDLKLRKEEIHKEANRRPDWPGYEIPDEIRDMLERRALKRACGYDSEDDLPGDPDEADAYINVLPEIIGDHQESVLRHHLEFFGPITQSAKTKKTRQEWSDWRRKLFNRRFNIVRFVGENRKPNSKQIKWRSMVAKWNEAYPLEPLNSSQMARICNRGIREDGIMVQIMVMNSLDAGRKLADPQDLKDWRDGKPHIRIIKTSHFSVTDSITGTKGGKSK